jgi:hypothetical protein
MGSSSYAYKKATDEQLRHRDALEKEIRQRDADKIQREAGRLDAIDRARAQLAVPVGVTESPRRRGARPKYPWEVMGAKIPANGLSAAPAKAAGVRISRASHRSGLNHLNIE